MTNEEKNLEIEFTEWYKRKPLKSFSEKQLVMAAFIAGWSARSRQVSPDAMPEETQKIEDGGAAFPTPHTSYPNGEVRWGATGMSLRDWFAGQSISDDIEGYLTNMQEEGITISRELAKYKYADAMIASRQQKEKAV